MKVLYLLRFDAESKGGGDVIQIRKYAEFVRGCGGEASFTSSLTPDATGHDLIHACNIDRPETYFQIMHVARTFPGTPIILTPIHHSNAQRREYERHGRRGVLRLVNLLCPSYQFREALKFLFRGFRNRALLSPSLRFLTVRQPQQTIAAKASLALLASQSEQKWCEEDYQIRFARHGVFPNGFQKGGAVSDSAVRDIDVIMTGRIESRKNQVSVLKALAGSKLKVCLVGALNQSHRGYLAELNAILAANPTFEHLGARPHPETLSLLNRARLYISASWLEVMSLSDLEAFAAGCKVVASKHGSTREVLGDRVRYVNPASIEEIRTVLMEELAKPPPSATADSNRLIDSYQWENLGATLVEIYRREISGKPSAGI